MVTKKTIKTTKKAPKPRKKTPLLNPRSSGNRKLLVSQMTQSALAMTGQFADYNPDELVRDRGEGVKVYQDMLRDPYIKAALNLKKFSVAKLPTRIFPASSDPRDIEIAKCVEWNLENMDTSVDELLWGMMDAVDVGYSISEINYRVLDLPPYAGKIGLKSVKSKDPYVFTFEIDDYGDIAYIYQRYMMSTVMTGGVDDKFPPWKFLTMAFQPKYNNPYGQSDLRAAYRAYFIKDWAWKFRAIYMEKFGMPPLVGRFPNGTPEARRKQLEEVLESIQNETVITMPEDLSVEVIKIAMEGRVSEYERAIADLNKEILIGILGSFMAVEEGKRTGARAAGQVHFAVSTLFMEHLAKMIEDAINHQLIKRLVDLNYDVEGRYPKWRFDLSQNEILLRDIEVDERLVNLGVKLDASYFYDKYRRPTPADTEGSRNVGPDNLSEFEHIRSNSLPEDPKKISQLRDMYKYMALSESNRRKIKLDDASRVAYDLAGEERDYMKKTGSWRDGRSAYKSFVERLQRTNGDSSDNS